MTCPGCSRDVTLIGGLCGHCESTISRGVAEAIDELDFEAEVVDVAEHKDGYYHVRFDMVAESLRADGGDRRALGSAADETRVGHCRHDDIDVYVGRGRDGAQLGTVEIGERGWLGNPFSVDDHGRVQCIERFRSEFEARLEADEEFRESIAELQGAVLGCWCQRLEDDGPGCHAEVIAEWADRLGRGQDV